MTTREELIDATTEVAPKRGRGRPRKEQPGDIKLSREERVPLGGFRDILTLRNTDPNYHYYWGIDESEDGSQIARCLQAGYVMVRPEEKVTYGEASVYKSNGLGSVIRVSAGGGLYHYLMKLPMEFHLDDQRRNAERVNQTEQSLKNQGGDTSGFYGDVSIK